MPVSHAWLGHGTCLFLELGDLSEGKVRRNGSIGNPTGEITIIVDFDWRIERKRSILIGSEDTKKRLENAINSLVGSRILSVETIGRIPELQIGLSNSLWVTTYSCNSGQPQWGIIFKTTAQPSIGVSSGSVSFENKDS